MVQNFSAFEARQTAIEDFPISPDLKKIIREGVIGATTKTLIENVAKVTKSVREAVQRIIGINLDPNAPNEAALREASMEVLNNAMNPDLPIDQARADTADAVNRTLGEPANNNDFFLSSLDSQVTNQAA